MFSPWAGLRLARHGDQRHPCYGPSSGELVDLLLRQHGLVDDGRAGVR
jgi:hypothetical protein